MNLSTLSSTEKRSSILENNLKWIITWSAVLGLFFCTRVSLGQRQLCNTFDSNIINIQIDSSSIWEIGQPTKVVFDSSYAGANSIVTKLDSLYPRNDTSTFYMIYSYPGFYLSRSTSRIPYFIIEFNHRFITDSFSGSFQDYGEVSLSIDKGANWYNALKPNYGTNIFYHGNQIHFFEETGNTVTDSLIVSGNSNGWIQSHVEADLYRILQMDNLSSTDSVIVRFRFFSDEIGGSQGWQIDDICLDVFTVGGFSENGEKEQIAIYPNPANATFQIELSTTQTLNLFNTNGALIQQWNGYKGVNSFHLKNIPPGIYFLSTQEGFSKLVVQ